MTSSLSTWSSNPVPDRIKQLFHLLHGRYGSAFLDKFRNGVVKNDRDMGIEITRHVWADGLAEFDDLTLARALKASDKAHPTWPPTLPEFQAMCRKYRPFVATAQPDAPALEMSSELRSKYVTACREMIAKTLARRAGSYANASNLPGLLANVARAVGLAGGDDAKALMDLERRYLAGHQ